jgi:hypothetical protein
VDFLGFVINMFLFEQEAFMSRRGAIALFAAAALALVLFGIQTPSNAAMKKVELNVPGCV